ncbi:MAG TPA: amidohydrolase family protein [Clostridia bacterium]
MKAVKIIDAHVHIFPEKIAEKATKSIGSYYGIEMFASGTIEELLRNGEKINVYKYIVHSTATKVEQVETINNFISETQSKYKNFIGFGTLHPELDDVESEVERIISLGLKGVKLHPDFQGFNIDDPCMMPIYGAIEKKQLPVLIHMGDENKDSSTPKRLSNVIKLFPNLTVIAAHFGGYQMWDDSIEYLVGKNLYFDTSSTLAILEKEKVTNIIRRHGVEKILFGTDYPMWSHEEELQRFYNLELTDEERELILWKNASKLLNLE